MKYCPDFNPIETVFAQVKIWYKHERLFLIANGKDFDTTQLIRRAFKQVRAETIEKSIAKSLNLIRAIR